MIKTNATHILVYITTPAKAEAKRIAQALVTEEDRKARAGDAFVRMSVRAEDQD